MSQNVQKISREARLRQQRELYRQSVARETTEESINSVAVHGRIVDISPVKTSKKDTRVKYIEGRLTDGKEVCRFVSFSPSKIKSEIDGALQLNSDESLKFENCSVKKSKIGTGYEIVMTQRSTVACSPKKFHVDDDFMKQKVDLHGVHESSLKDMWHSRRKSTYWR